MFRERWFLLLGLATFFSVAQPALATPQAPDRGAVHVERGRDVWFNSTFGGEQFFSRILPRPPFNLPLGFDLVLATPRDSRFEVWGVMNDPDCDDGDASSDYFDTCADPNSSGVIGIRKFAAPNGGPPLLGVACAACHAGPHPANPPADPNHPTWDNIHPTIGNQFLRVGDIFKGHLSPHDPRYQVFSSWAKGTVDTTVLEDDHINNPGVITGFFQVPDRPYFNVRLNGRPIREHRSGQGGEDDTGCRRAALRVYFNIGMCAAECMLGHLANGPGGSQTPIDLGACAAVCPAFVEASRAVADLCDFTNSIAAPKLTDAPNGSSFIDMKAVPRGQQVFTQACASCHSNRQSAKHDVLSDDLIHPYQTIGTNRCRALTTNWMAGHIWAEFSSDDYKQRPGGGPGFYRDMPLLAAWATAPFLHNNRLGHYNGDPSVAGRIAAYEDAMDQLLNPWKRDFFGSVELTTDFTVLPTPFGNVTLPAGVPVASFASLDPTNPLVNLCPDFIENEGHWFGADLSATDKRALIEFLKTR